MVEAIALILIPLSLNQNYLMKNIILTGSTGMIGNLILQQCLASKDVSKITSIVRKSTGVTHPKLQEIIHTNFLNFSDVEQYFVDQDICFFCLGVYTGAVDKNKFREITVDYTRAFAETLRKMSKKTTFCLLSGQGADQTEKSSLMFARDKGTAENLLIVLQFDQFYTFRPGYIYPVTPRNEPNMTYKIMRLLYKPVAAIYPNIGISSEILAAAMMKVGFEGKDQSILENEDIRKV
jgi:nucleoside-diphosphate-sugar epimerase